MTLARLRWLAIVAPLAFLVLLVLALRETLHHELHEFPGIVYLLVVLGAFVAAFSFGIFGVVARLERRILEQNRELSLLNEIAAASAENLELDELLVVTLDKVLAAAGVDAGIVCLADMETDELVASCHRGLSDELARRIERQTLGREPVGADVVPAGQRPVVEELFEHPRVAELASREGLRSAVSVPLSAEGEVYGVLGVASRRERRFAPGEVRLLTSIAAQLDLAVRNALLFAKAEQRNRELAAVMAVGRAATSSLLLSDLLDKALDSILSVASAEAAEVWLLEDGGDLVLARQRGPGAEAFLERARVRPGEGLPGLAAQTRAPVIVHDLPADGRVLRGKATELGFKAFCALPLVHRGETVGVLAVAARDAEALSSPTERRLLEGIGEQVACAVDNARLHERVLDGAVLEERERIARELHDGLAQVLGYINAQTLAIKKLLASGRADEAGIEVAAMEEAAKRVYTDVREAIVGLRAARGGLAAGLRTYLADSERVVGARLRLEIGEEVEALRLPVEVEIQVIRIVQEALSNVRKHAVAASATVSLEAAAGDLTVEIADDGQGFDVDRPVRTGWPHFGLQTMRERAEAVGGNFRVESSLGAGTRVAVRVPIETTTEVRDARLARR